MTTQASCTETPHPRFRGYTAKRLPASGHRSLPNTDQHSIYYRVKGTPRVNAQHRVETDFRAPIDKSQRIDGPDQSRRRAIRGAGSLYAERAPAELARSRIRCPRAGRTDVGRHDEVNSGRACQRRDRQVAVAALTTSPLRMHTTPAIMADVRDPQSAHRPDSAEPRARLQVAGLWARWTALQD